MKHDLGTIKDSEILICSNCHRMFDASEREAKSNEECVTELKNLDVIQNKDVGNLKNVREQDESDSNL